MNVPFRVSLINAHARSGRPVLGDRAGAAAFAAGLKATVLAVEEVQSPSNPQETEIMYVVTFDQPEYWIRRGLNEVSSLTKRWPASFFNTIEDDGVRPAGYVDHNIGDGQNRQADMGGRRRKTRKKKGGINPAEFNYLRSNYIHILEQRDRLERELQECRQDLHNATSMDSAGVRESKSHLEGGRKTRKKKGGTLNKLTKRKLDTLGIDVDARGDLTKFEKKVYPEQYRGYTMKDAINLKTGREFKSMMEKQIAKNKQQGGHHLYKRLGVSKYASQKQIRKAFKTLKKKRKATKKVREAYKILSNKKSRKQYNNRYRKAVKRGGKRKTRRRKGGNENCYGFQDPKDLRLCNEIHQAAQYYNTSRPDRLSTGQKIARKIKNRTTRRNNPKPESQQQVAQQKRATFLEFKDKLHPVLGKLKEAEDKIRTKLQKTIEGPDDPMGEKQRELEAEYDEAFSKTNEKLSLMNTINQNLNGEDKCPLPAEIEKARNDYSNRLNPFGRKRRPLEEFNVAY